MTHEPTIEELHFLADRDLAQDKDHIIASGASLAWLIAQLTQWPIRVDEDKTTCLRFLMMSAADTLRQLREPPCGHWATHHDHPVEDWQYEVANGDTRLGYWQWVWAREQADA